jgi:hypothetical protein
VYAFVDTTGEGERSEFNEFIKRLEVLHTEYVHKQVTVGNLVLVVVVVAAAVVVVVVLVVMLPPL